MGEEVPRLRSAVGDVRPGEVVGAADQAGVVGTVVLLGELRVDEAGALGRLDVDELRPRPRRAGPVDRALVPADVVPELLVVAAVEHPRRRGDAFDIADELLAPRDALAPRRHQVVLLAREKLGAVERQQRLTSLDGLTDLVDGQLLDVCVVLEHHICDLRLVDLYSS